MRYLKEGTNKIQTFTGILPKDVLAGDSISTTEIKGSFLPEDISDMSILPNASKIFYLFDIGDGSAGITAGPLGESKFQMFSSPFTEWLSQYPNIKTITVTTKPASTVPGYMYAIDTSKKDLKKVMGNINGLTTLMSPDSKMVLYSKSEAGNISLGIYHLDTGDFDILGVKTLPEKCVWGKNSDVVYCSVPRFINQAEYPDAWYQGEISFSDTLWKINPQTENATVIADPAQYQAGADIDGIKLGLNEAENYLFFINKKDSYLWELALK
jgi:hypothetical protein